MRPIVSGKDLTILALLGAVVYLAATNGKIVVQPIIDLSKLNQGGSTGSALSKIGSAILSA